MSVTILMSTYNGERYLAEQLDSIIGQDMQEWRLVVRDDGSADDTIKILQRYAAKDERVQVVADGQNMGVIRSFEYLLQHYGTGEYIAFADQDDVWLPNKLRISTETIQRAEKEYGKSTPIAVHTDLIVADEQLQEISKSYWDYAGIKPHILNKKAEYLAIYNSVTGCTLLLNQAAKRVSLPFRGKALMHDSAIAVSVKQRGGQVVPIDEATLYYRQHGDNASGAVKYDLWRSFSQRYQEAKEHYRAYHPDIFPNVAAFIYWKMRSFCAEHL
ncbi:MAG TPA: glycosyltransferase family 2 protein [Bacteroidales bacterium]|mgnify:CR=1 FL=1|nr:glycosyltransferase family 2 protein [Bacteroidales bacterium]